MKCSVKIGYPIQSNQG